MPPLGQVTDRLGDLDQIRDDVVVIKADGL